MTVPPSSRRYFDELASTQATALAFVREGFPPRTWIVAGRQTDGLGRNGRRWESPRGGLYVSIIARAPESNVALVPLAVGASVADRLEHDFHIGLRLKWPNDLVVEDGRSVRKLAGILVDHLLAPWGDAVVIGLGVNVLGDAGHFGSSLVERATTLEVLVEEKPNIEEVESSLVDCTLGAVDRLERSSEVPKVVARIRKALFGVGRVARVDGVSAGVVEGVGPEGELLVTSGSELRSIRSGEVAIEAGS